ncbi:MAG: preprotein translocase subunit YajC [Lentisphaerae bacterium RIFOXYC12_FULL_60_16]|nr:MAG: preprotein translocase subunit YajC [Lentisphaerae bacterium RIFOXYC12_FULL_60_16]
MTAWTTTILTIAQAAPGGQSGGMLGMMLPLLVIFGIFYFMLIRPQQRKDKERRVMIDTLKSGARVIFSGGIMGTVTNVKDQTFVIKIADNVKIEVAKGAVSQVVEKGDKVEVEPATR